MRRFGRLDGGIAFVEPGIRLRGAAHVDEDRADGGDQGRYYRNLCGEALVPITMPMSLRRVLDLVIMRAAYMKAAS